MKSSCEMYSAIDSIPLKLDQHHINVAMWLGDLRPAITSEDIQISQESVFI